jgi:restriction endonuclease S subunit
MDCQFYFPKHMELENRLKASHYPVYKIGEKRISTRVVDGPFGTQLKVEDYVDSGVPLIRVSNCRHGEITANEELVYISDQKHSQLSRSEVLPDDVLLTKAGHILGYSAVFPKIFARGNITSHLAAIRLTENVDPQYLADFLTSNLGNSQIYRWGNKATRPELNTDEVRQILVPLPPLDIQQQLVDEMEAARSQRKAKLAEADGLLKGMDGFVLEQLGLSLPPKLETLSFGVTLRDLLSNKRLNANYYNPERMNAISAMQTQHDRYPSKKLGEIADFVRETVQVQPTDAYMGLAGVQTYTGELSGVAEEATGQAFRYQVDDVLFGRLRPYLNKVYRSEQEGLCSTEFHVIRLHKFNQPPILPVYLSSILRSSLILAQTRHMMTGNTHPRIANEDVVDLLIPMPDLATQTKIVDELNRRREMARRLRLEAEQGWQAARVRFEEALLAP